MQVPCETILREKDTTTVTSLSLFIWENCLILTTTELDREQTIYNAKIMLLMFCHSNLLFQWMFKLDPGLINVLFLKVEVN